MRRHAQRNEAVHAAALDYDAAATRGDAKTIYRFGEGVLDGDDLALSTEEIRIPGYGEAVSLDLDDPFKVD